MEPEHPPKPSFEKTISVEQMGVYGLPFPSPNSYPFDPWDWDEFSIEMN